MNTENPEKNKSPNQSSNIWVGMMLILLGIVFFAQRLGSFTLRNWWALFILIPALSAFATAFTMWRKDGKFHFGVWSTLYGGLFPLLVAGMFLFDLDWGVYWPLFIILPGFGTMLSGLPFYRPENVKVPAALLRHRPWPFFIGLSALLLGLTFLGRTTGFYDATALIPFENWWGIFILIPALGGVLAGVLLLVGQNFILSLINFAAAVVIGMAAVIAIYDLNWNLMNMVMPVLLILAGLALLVGFGGKKNQSA